MLFKNKVVVISGANQGLGLYLSKKFYLDGATLFLCSRNYNLLNKEISKFNKQTNKIYTYKVDVSDNNQTKSFIKKCINKVGKIDILISNAGIYGPIGECDKVSKLAWKKAIDINLFGSFNLISNTIPYMKKKKFGKIIQLSGGGATSPLPNFSSYAASKAAVVRLCETIAEELKKHKIDVNCIAPGPLNTRLLNKVLTAGPKKTGNKFFQKSLKQKNDGGASMEKTLKLIYFLVSKEANGITGKLISSLWDNYELSTKNKKNKNQFSCSDIFTLRRIIGKDREMSIFDV